MTDNQDNVVALLPWDRTVRRAFSRRRVLDLLEDKKADEVIRNLTPLDAYYTLKALGVEDSLPVLGLLEPEQVQALFDLDVWQRDTLRAADMIAWLDAFKAAGLDAFHRAARALDREMFALLLQRRLHVALKPREDDESHLVPSWLAEPNPALEPLVETPDGRYIIAAKTHEETLDGTAHRIDEEERKAILQIVDDLYREEDFERVVGLLRIAESDVSSVLEEEAFRFRNARLEDLGFPPLERALEIYGPLDPSSLRGQEFLRPAPDLELSVVHVESYRGGFFEELLAGIDDPDLMRRLEAELVALSNAALVVAHVEPGDVEGMRPVLERVRAYLQLALLYDPEPNSLRADSLRPDSLRPGTVGSASDARSEAQPSVDGRPDSLRPGTVGLELGLRRLRLAPLRDLFRIAHTLTLERGGRARKLRGISKLWNDADRAVLDALAAKYPQFPRQLESPSETGMDRRPFAMPEDLARADAALEELEGLVEGVRALRLDAEHVRLPEDADPPENERTFDILITTAAVNVLLGRNAEVRPLSSDDLSHLATRVVLEGDKASFLDSELDPALERLTRALEEKARRSIERRSRRGLRELAEALVTLRGKKIDPRFLGCVVRETK